MGVSLLTYKKVDWRLVVHSNQSMDMSTWGFAIKISALRYFCPCRETHVIARARVDMRAKSPARAKSRLRNSTVNRASAHAK